MRKPLVSVVINNYNYGAFVGDAIRSAVSQSYPRTEVVVVDDGSTDNSKDVIDAYEKAIVSVFKTNEGQSSAFNAGFAKSSGEIVCFLDADDLFLPHKVEEVVAAYKDPGLGWCVHPLQAVNALAQPIPGPPDVRYPTGRYDFREEYLRGKPTFWAAPTSGLTFRRAVLAKLLPMPGHLRITADNYLTFSFPAFSPGFYISECLSLQRIHGANAYTAKDDPRFKATVQMSIAKALHDSIPELRRLSNRLFANAVAANWAGGAQLREVSADVKQHFERCEAREKLEVLTRMAYRMLRPRREPPAAMLNSAVPTAAN